MGVKDIKDILKKLNVSLENCFEKGDLVKKYNEWYKMTFGVVPQEKKEAKKEKF